MSISIKPTSEIAFESVLERYLLDGGYKQVDTREFDKDKALFPRLSIEFIKYTQPKEWQKLEDLLGANTEEQVISDLCKWMDNNGSLNTLRHGFKCYGRKLHIAHFKA